LNEKIYGESLPDDALKASIATHGIFNPIIINRNKEIISGTRRWLAAQAAGFDRVPVISLLEETEDGLLSELFLIESNHYRDKTPEQKGREFIELKRIEAGLAKQRQAQSPGGKGKRLLKENLPEAITGQSRDKAADAVGLSAKTAEKLATVVQLADSGDEGARSVLDSVNAGEKSVSAAYREAVEPQQEPTFCQTPLGGHVSALEKVSSKLIRCFECSSAPEEKVRVTARVGEVIVNLKRLLSGIAMPVLAETRVLKVGDFFVGELKQSSSCSWSGQFLQQVVRINRNGHPVAQVWSGNWFATEKQPAAVEAVVLSREELRRYYPENVLASAPVGDNPSGAQLHFLTGATPKVAA
jgi:hypothetical protein